MRTRTGILAQVGMNMADDSSVVLEVAMQNTAHVFFFSSRRRHTRLQGDWSSDVCSSDLPHWGYDPTAIRASSPWTSPAAGTYRSGVVTPMRAKIMKITYTDSRDGMVLIDRKSVV